MCKLRLRKYACGKHVVSSYLTLCQAQANIAGAERIPLNQCPDFTHTDADPDTESQCLICERDADDPAGKWLPGLRSCVKRYSAALSHTYGTILRPAHYTGFLVAVNATTSMDESEVRWGPLPTSYPKAVTVQDIEAFARSNAALLEERPGLLIGLFISRATAPGDPNTLLWDSNEEPFDRMYPKVVEKRVYPVKAVTTAIERGEQTIFVVSEDYRGPLELESGSALWEAIAGVIEGEIGKMARRSAVG